MAGSEGPGERKVSSLRELPQAIEPGRDLWPQIEVRLKDAQAAPSRDSHWRPAQTRRRRVPLRWLAAAAMVGSVAIGVWIGRSFLPVPGQASFAQSSATTARPAGGSASTFNAGYVTDPRYERQRAALLRSLQAQLAAMPPPARAKVLASLATVQQAKQDLEQALGKDPGNALLQELLVNTCQDEMRVLTDVREASEPGTGI
jgi:hypothetical protein